MLSAVQQIAKNELWTDMGTGSVTQGEDEDELVRGDCLTVVIIRNTNIVCDASESIINNLELQV
jgi:hypothetical protein